MRHAMLAYKKVSLESAPPATILDQVFERLERDIGDASAAVRQRDIVAKAKAVDHAIQLVGELSASLDRDAVPELADNLLGLYGFVEAHLVDGSIRLVTEPFDEALRVVGSLRAAFREVSHGV